MSNKETDTAKEKAMGLVKKFRWIHFIEIGDTGKTKVYNCYNTEQQSFLGHVKWYSGFRKYSFFPQPNIVFESQCLKDISLFLDQLMIERKLQKQSVLDEIKNM